ncbi:MAG: carboxyl transferase domain-containing protein [Bacteroidota bacterium]
MARIGTPAERTAAFLRNEEHLRRTIEELGMREEAVRLGGGPAAAAKQHERGKRTARERILRLVDPGSSFLEIGLLAAYEMYGEYGGAPSSGTLVGIGSVAGRDVVVVANDATVKAGAWFPVTCRKNLRAQEISIENRLPIVYLVDSAGVFLPLQSEIFPDRDHFGRIFRNNAVMSSLGIPQIAAIMGPCVAGGAYLPIMSDEALIVEGTGSVFLAGSHLVRAAIGEEIGNEELGGAAVHSEISGVTDHRMANDDECLEKIRSIVGKLGRRPAAVFDRADPAPCRFPPEEIHGILPAERSKPYDMYEVLARLLDGGEMDEYKAGYGRTLITGYGRMDGWAVGIVANQRAVVKTRKGEMQVGGVIYSDSADKAARFIMNCSQKLIPLVFLQDVTGFMVGSRAEHAGIIKDGAKMVSAVANAAVPKFTIVAGNSYGAGNYAMCGRAYDPRFLFAWPSAQIAVMGGKQASETLLGIRLQAMGKGGERLSDARQRELLADIRSRYEKEADPYYAAARLWVDGIIRPEETRQVISRGIALASQNADIPRWSTGVIQT